MNPYTTLKIGDIVKHNPSGCKAEVIGIFEDLIWLKFHELNANQGQTIKHVIAPSLSPWLKYKKGDLVLTSFLTNDKRVLEIREVTNDGYFMIEVGDMEGNILDATYDDSDIIRKVGVATEGE